MMDKFTINKDFFNHSYYWIAKSLAEITGLWPYETTRKNICRPILLLIATFQIIIQIMGVIHYRNHFDVVLASIPPLLVCVVSIIKMINSTYHSDKMKLLFDWIKEDWSIVKGEEKNILCNYAFVGQILATGYTAATTVTTVTYLLEPKLTAMLENIIGSNYTEPIQGLYPVPMYFGGFNVDKIYYWTLLISYINCMVVVSVSLSNDTLFIIYMQHLCGRFAGLRHMIKNLPNSNSNKRRDVGYEYICKCISMHNRILKFAEAVGHLYVWCLLCVVGCNMIMVSITVFQAVTQVNTLQSITKYFLFISTQIIHLFFECFMSQQLINHSTHIQMCINEAMWYENSIKTQKMLILMILRCQKPCRLSAGKLITLSMESFCTILKTSVSYFTVFLSMQ